MLKALTPRANMFPAREANFEQVTYWKGPQIALDAGYSAQALVLPGHFGASIFRPFLDSFLREASLLSISGVVLFLRALGCLFTIGVRISWKKWRWKESDGG